MIDPTQELDEEFERFNKIRIELKRAALQITNKEGTFPPSMISGKSCDVDGIRIVNPEHIVDVQRMAIRALKGTDRDPGLLKRILNRLEDNQRKFQTGEWDAQREAKVGK